MNISKPPFRVVSLFCGLGGADAGLYRASDALGIPVEVVAAIDSWEPAVRVYNANHRHPVARVADVKQLTRADLPEHDLLIGGPPCQPFSTAGKLMGHADPRNCIPDFLRLVGDSAYIMENVRHGLIAAPWSEKLSANDFGDCTRRQRWFYSNFLLHCHPVKERPVWRDIAENDTPIAMLTNGHAMRLVSPDEPAPSLTSNEALNKHRKDGLARLGARKITINEMRRAHSLPQNWDWAGTTITQQSKMIANSWPVGLATAVCGAMLTALAAERENENAA